MRQVILYGNVYDVTLSPLSYPLDQIPTYRTKFRSQNSSHDIQEAARLYVTFVSASMLEAFNNAQILGLAGKNATEEYDVCIVSLS